MIIKEIVLNNFRIYGGYNPIDLAPDGDKNIIIVSGKNGYGKTTFLMSLVWCLYGKQMQKVDEMYQKEIKDEKNYGSYIANSLNLDSRQNGEARFSVSVTFAEIEDPDIDAKEICVERYFDQENGEDLIIRFDGREHNEWKYLNKKERTDYEEHFIREHILPLEVAKFFFFDAEKIVAFAQSDSEELGRELSNAYSQVLGIQKYVNLREDLDKMRSEYRKSSATGEERRNYDRLDQQIEEDNRRLTQLNLKLDAAIQNIDRIKGECEKTQTLIVQNGSFITEDELNQLRETESQYNTIMQATKDSIKDLYNFIPFGLAGGLFAELIEQVQKEVRFKQQSQRFDAVEDKANAVLSDLDNERLKANFFIDYQVRSFYEKSIIELIKKHFGSSEDGEDFEEFALLHNISEVQMSSMLAAVSQVKDVKERFVRIYNEYNNNKASLENISQQVREAEAAGESPILTQLRAAKKKLDSDYEKAMEERFHTLDEIEAVKEEIKADKQNLETLGKKIKLSNDVQKYDDELSRLISILDNFILLYKSKKIESLKHRIAAKLKSFMHKTDLIEDVDIFTIGEGIAIVLKDGNNRIIDQSTLSMGEKQLFSSAILGSLVEETSYRFPVFIDSPLQKLDLNHSTNILTKFYPSVSSQVVMFPLLHKELTPQEYELIKDKVSKIYLIENHQKKSQFKELEEKDELFINPLGM